MIKNLLKNKFVSSTLILLIGGSISKLLGFILKIYITRTIGVEGIGLYSLLSPTMGLLTVIAIFSYPTAIAKIIAEGKRSSKTTILGVIPFSIIFNTIVILIVILMSSLLANNLLHRSELYLPIICIGLILPFIGISSIIKGYFWGKQRMGPYILSNIAEQIIRIIILLIVIPYTLDKSIILTICVIILVNIISETFSIIVMLLYIPKGQSIHIKDFKIKAENIKDVLEISIPSTSSKVIGSIFYFFEPIILTNILLYIGYSSSFILKEYGLLNGYSLSLLLLPSFFTQSISTSLIPEVSSYYYLKDYKTCIKRIKQITILSFLIGFIFTLIIYLFPEYFLNLLFNTTEGITYIKVLAPFTLLFFIEVPLISAMQAINKAKTSMNITLITSSIRLVLTACLSFFSIGIYGLIVGIIASLLLTSLLNYKALKKALT